MGCGRGKDKAVTGTGEQAGQTVPLAAAVGYVMALINNDDIPVALF